MTLMEHGHQVILQNQVMLKYKIFHLLIHILKLLNIRQKVGLGFLQKKQYKILLMRGV